MYNNAILQLEKDLVDVINKSGLHVGTISLVIDKVNTTVKQAFEMQIKKEQEESSARNNNLNDMIEIDNNLVD